MCAKPFSLNDDLLVCVWCFSVTIFAFCRSTSFLCLSTKSESVYFFCLKCKTMPICLTLNRLVRGLPLKEYPFLAISPQYCPYYRSLWYHFYCLTLALMFILTFAGPRFSLNFILESLLPPNHSIRMCSIAHRSNPTHYCADLKVNWATTSLSPFSRHIFNEEA